MSRSRSHQGFSQVVRPQVADIRPYVPGKPISSLQRELGIKQVIKLASNENPLGCSPRSTAAIQNHLTELSRIQMAVLSI